MKQIIACFAAILAIACLSFAAFAATETEELSCTASASQLQPGDEVTLTVSISGAPAVRSVALVFDYDVADTFTLLDGRWLLSDAMLSKFDDTTTLCGTAAIAFSSSRSINGEIFELSLKVKDTAPDGEATISVSPVLKDLATSIECEDASATVSVSSVHTHSYGAGVLTAATRETEAYYTYTCTNCGESYVEYLEPTAMDVSFIHALVVSSEYSLNFRIYNTVVAGASDYWMEFETFAPGSETGTITIAEAEAQGTKQQKFASPGISAKNLNDKIVAKLYMIKDGIKYVSQTDEYNVVNYYLQASAAYASAAEGTKNYYLIKALEAILNYGSFTQTYFGYNTEQTEGDEHSGLVNLHMPEDVRKTSIADYADVVAEQQRIEYDDCASPLFTFSSTAVIMQQKITNNLKYTFVDKTYDYTTLTFRGTYTTIKGEVKEIEIPGTAMTATGTKTRTLNVYIDTVAAKDLRQMVTGALYDADGNQVSISVASSVESYAVRIPDAAQYESVKAAILGVLDYSDYVALYLAK